MINDFLLGLLTGLSLSCVVLSICIYFIKKYKNEIRSLNIKYNFKIGYEIEYKKCLISKLKLLKSELYLEKAKNKTLNEAIDKYGNEILKETFKQYTEHIKNNN